MNSSSASTSNIYGCLSSKTSTFNVSDSGIFAFNEKSTCLSDNSTILVEKPWRPSALQLIGPNQGPSRTLWSEVPEVIQSEIFRKFVLVTTFRTKL